jgi:hypothetical protein
VLLRSGDTRTTSEEFEHPLTPLRQIVLLIKTNYCPHPLCRQTSIQMFRLNQTRKTDAADWTTNDIEVLSILPDSKAKPFPDYIPKPILQDYREACRIVDLSPKASASLARRCLQGMIRDFWEIRQRTLKDEIDALEEKIDSLT